MSEKHKVVFGIYNTRPEVEGAVEVLRGAGFEPSDISVLLPDDKNSQYFAHVKSTKGPEGVAAGAGTGVIIGGALGWLAGIGALAIPGVGPFIAAGPIVAALAAAGIGGTVGGISGGLIGLGIPEYEAKRYEDYINDGGILVSVHVDSSHNVAALKKILEDTGAEDIASTSAMKSEHMLFVHHPDRSKDESVSSKFY